MERSSEGLVGSEELVGLVEVCVRQVAEEEGVGPVEELGPGTVLFGPDGLFDSLGVVSLVLAVEEAVEERFDASITLADQRAMAESTSPFRTVGLLAEYTDRLVREAG